MQKNSDFIIEDGVVTEYWGNDETVIMPEGATIVDSHYTSVVGECAFEGCASLKSLILPESLREIYEDAFSGCSALESINIPDGVICIADNAFDGCDALEESVHKKIQALPSGS